ncbi:CpeS-like protein [Rubidibacter lacunae KORDI 51-2]|uniref:Chromophore lyase CpcS/CpeS n=1 Tax=Rubidibacter lacunae KORDI 51-2 TaxID=582515 RepID=U5DMC0_9CHRO|nr:phycobiliprotein lyase [Rubidibacter lacunae]ERN42017.1 CpeS-like protein [Rubidibacter lacunae KORDI 51-2]
MDAMDFFRRSAGTWRSLRTTHHLPFRRAENGSSCVVVEALAAGTPQTVEICQMHDIDPSLCVGGAHVTWNGAMAWDKDDENHAGSTIFAIVPDPGSSQTGRLLRDRGYAEIVPVAGCYVMDGEALVLTTDYETMGTFERFWFAGPDLRMRTSTVTRFGGFNSATFCAEIRLDESGNTDGAAEIPTLTPTRELPALFAW